MLSAGGRMAHRGKEPRRPENFAVCGCVAQERAERRFRGGGNGVEAADKILLGYVAQNSPALPWRKRQVKRAFVQWPARDIRNAGMERR